jgi:superfamily II DNA or RNA helicase
MTMQLQLREYQTEALTALNTGWQNGGTRLAVVLPTGAGKTVCFSELSKQAHARGERPLILVHREELVNQSVDKLHSAMPDANIGRVKADWNQVDADVIVASVQTLAREKRRNQISNVGMVIVDEAHHALAPSYRNTLDHFGSFADEGRGTPTSGWSATLVRGDGKGLGDVWEEVVYERDILWMIRHGYLVDVKGKKITVDGLDLTQVARSRGDLMEGGLGEALMAVNAGDVIADAYREHAKDRQGVIFAPTVASARAFAESMNAAGFVTETISGMTPLDIRKDIYDRLRKGEVQVLSNCMVLTEGWDEPQISCAVVARPTENAGLYTQMVGRVLRPFPGKKDALILDVVGVAGKHRLASLVDLSSNLDDIEEGESLSEAKERKETRQRHSGVVQIEGEQESEDFDPFDRSGSAWLQTYKGTWFIPTRDTLYFLWPNGQGKFTVGKKAKGHNRAKKMVEDVDLGYGMAWAEQMANREDPTVASKNASWRKRKSKPSHEQLRLIEQINQQRRMARMPELNVPWGISKADLSNMLSIHFASRVLD